MPVTINQKLYSLISSLNHRKVFLFYLLVAIVLRLPFFFRDYIDRDESTFILMAQSVVDGNLLYTELWDLKPPMIFYFLALVIYVFGKSFIAIRLAGTVVVATVAYFTYLIGLKTHSKILGVWVGLFTVYLSSLFGSVQGVMSEHLSMAFFLPAVYLLLSQRTYSRFLLSGLLMGLALMTKLNLAYAAVLAALFILFYKGDGEALKERFCLFVSFCSGTLLGLGIQLLPFVFSGKTGLFVNSVVIAPWAYANMEEAPFLKVVPFILFLAGFTVLAVRKSLLSFKDQRQLLLGLMVLGIALSFIRIGKINGHYLLQFYPLFIILFAIAILGVLNRFQKTLSLAGLILLLLLPVESYREYGTIVKAYKERGSFFNGEGIRVPHYLKGTNLKTGDVLYFEYHIGYWVMGVNPPSKVATHPSNICREVLFPYLENPRNSALDEIQFLLESVQPEIIVTREGRSVFDRSHPAVNDFVERILERDYRRLQTVGEAVIYRRL